MSQTLIIENSYYWAHPEVAAGLAAHFDKEGKLNPGYTMEGFDAYVAENIANKRLQYMGHYPAR